MFENENTKKMGISIRIRQLRKRDGISQERLAAKLQCLGFDCDRNYIKRIEQGDQRINVYAIRALAKVFRVSYAYLIDGEQRISE